MNHLKTIAPAKVNLFLAVGNVIGSNNSLAGDFSTVKEGYHPVLNIMHTVLLHDVLYFSYCRDSQFSLSVNFVESSDVDQPISLPKIEQTENIVYKAVEKLASEFKAKSNYKINILIEKNIPHQAGLGGGSSDAAAALVGACKIFGVDTAHKKVSNLAKSLGADVPFFLSGGCALMTGAGDVLKHSLQPINREIVLIRPNSLGSDSSGLSTHKVYSQFDNMPQIAADLSGKDIEFEIPIEQHDDDCGCEHHHSKHINTNLVDAVQKLQFADEVPLFNNLAIASEALMPELTKIRTWLQKKYGDDNVLLCGSGSTTFVKIPDNEEIDDDLELIKEKGNWVKLTQLANIKARLMPIT